MPAKSWVDAHNEDDIDDIEDGERVFDGGCGIEGDSGDCAVFADFGERAVEVGSGFRVDGDSLRPGVDEGLDEGVDGRDHEVSVDGSFCVFLDSGDDGRPEGEVGDEVSVHDIEVEEVGAGILDIAHFLSEDGEVGGEEGGGDLHFFFCFTFFFGGWGWHRVVPELECLTG